MKIGKQNSSRPFWARPAGGQETIFYLRMAQSPGVSGLNRGQLRFPELSEIFRVAGWFEIEEQKNTNVYVSGLPEDVTDDEFKELMNKCGMIMYDPRTQKMKLKLYRDADGKPKGDGLCCYIKVGPRQINRWVHVSLPEKNRECFLYRHFFKYFKYPHTPQISCQICVQVSSPEKKGRSLGNFYFLWTFFLVKVPPCHPPPPIFFSKVVKNFRVRVKM